MSGIAAAKFETQLTSGNIKLIVHNHKIKRLELVPSKQGLYALAAQVHEGLRLGCKPAAAQLGQTQPPQFARKFAPVLLAYFAILASKVNKVRHKIKAAIVACVVIFGTGVAQANNNAFIVHWVRLQR